MNFRYAEIGIILIACNIPAFFDLVGLLLNTWTFNILLVIWWVPIIGSCLCVLTIAGLVLYVIDRKRFLNRARSSRFSSVLLLSMGLILIVEGAYFGWSTGASFRAFTTQNSEWHPLTLEKSAIYLVYFVWSVLQFVSGVLWLMDCSKLSSIKRVSQDETI